MAGLADESPYDEYAGYYAEAHDHVLDRAMIADQRFHLQSVLAKVHAMSMANGLEVRVPLLDRRIMDLAGAMDLRLLNPAPKGPPKLVLRKLAERLGVPQTVAAAAKRGFNIPNSRLLRRELAPLGEDLLNDNADVLAPYLKPDALRRLWRAHRDREANNGFALWPVLTLATWVSGRARRQDPPPPHRPSRSLSRYDPGLPPTRNPGKLCSATGARYPLARAWGISADRCPRGADLAY